MESVREQQKSAYEALKGERGYTNAMATPRVEKVIVSVGTGKTTDKKAIELMIDRLTRITGQKPAPRPARKSIAAFKLREGDIVGYQITLRGARMFDFLEKLFRVALPRTRDFRGIKRSAIDAMGNITIGIREHTIFPETPDEEMKDVFGFAVTIVTSAKDAAEAEALLRHLGAPLKHKEAA